MTAALESSEGIRRLRWKDIASMKDACLLARWTIRGQGDVRQHTHDFCELFLVESGHGRHRINGRSQELLPGHLVFIRAQDVHAMQGHGRDTVTFVNIAVALGVAETTAKRIGGFAQQAFGAQRSLLPLAVSLSSNSRDRMNVAIHGLAGSARDRLAAECFLLTALQIAQESVGSEGVISIAPEWLAAAVEGVKEPKVFQQGVAGFVSVAARSAEHVARETRRHYGMSPGELVAQARLEHAARRLELSDISVTELSFECGFESLSHFVRLFHRRYGEPPLRYRRRRWGLI
jgi:AraC family transcriptional regulator, dual regulator of chb operon